MYTYKSNEANESKSIIRRAEHKNNCSHEGDWRWNKAGSQPLIVVQNNGFYHK